jgi:hypothetical protein
VRRLAIKARNSKFRFIIVDFHTSRNIEKGEVDIFSFRQFLVVNGIYDFRVLQCVPDGTDMVENNRSSFLRLLHKK